MAKFIPVIIPQPGDDLKAWARQLTSQLQFLGQQLQSALAGIEQGGGGGGGASTTPITTPGGVTVIDSNGYYIDGLGRVVVDAAGLHVYDAVGFQVIDGPNVYINTEQLVDNAVETAKLAAGAVTEVKIGNDAITAPKIQAGAIVAGKLAANAIVANDGVIGTAAIADAQIANLNANKINAGSIAAERMEANIVTALNGKFATLSALASSLGVVQILSGGALFTQGATAYATGTGIWMGQDGGVYKWRAGNPAGARIQWTGSALEVYNSSNQLTIASGDVDWAGITGAGKPANNATVGADWSLNLTNRPSDEDILNAGSNLILNPDLSNSPTGNGTTAKGWSFNANSGSFFWRGVLQDSANGPPFDSSALMFYTNSTGADGQVSWITSDYIPVGLDRNYTVSAWLRRYSGNPSAYLGVIAYDANYTNLGYVYPAGLSALNSTTLSASWEHRYGVFGPGHTAFPAGTKYVRVVWWGTYLSIGATLATRFCFNEGVVPSRSVVPLDSSLINKINPITPSNVTTYIASAAIGTAQIANASITNAKIDLATANRLIVGTANIGNAAVNTLQIAGNAVIIPRHVITGAHDAFHTGNLDLTLGTFTTSSPGSGVVQCVFSIRDQIAEQLLGTLATIAAASSQAMTFAILRNGVTVKSFSATTTSLRCSWNGFVDTPGPGVSCTYVLRMYSAGSASKVRPTLDVIFNEIRN